MAVPRFLEFAQQYPSTLGALSSGLGAGVQRGESIFQTVSEAKLRKAQIGKMKAQAKDPLSGMTLTGPTGQYASYLRYRETLSPDKQSALDKIMQIGINKDQARTVYYGTNAAFRFMNPEQKHQLILEYQHRTGLPLSEVLKIFSYQGGVLGQAGGQGAPMPTFPAQPGGVSPTAAPVTAPITPEQKYQRVLNRGDLKLAQEALQYGMSLGRYKTYIRSQLGAQ